MGRIRLRTMTRPDGTCEPCDIFLRLPNWRLMVDADRILDAVKRTLPGAKVVPWERATRALPRDGKKPVIRQDAAAALVTYAARMAPGTWEDAQDVRARLKITHGTWFRIVPEAGEALSRLGARVEPAVGRRAARLTRAAS
jgi:hypothetical protein